MDFESYRPALSGRHADCRSLPRSPASWEAARRLFPNAEGKQKAWMKIRQKRLLDRGKIEKLVGAFRSLASASPEVAEKICNEADYFERNARAHAIPEVSPPTPLCWFESHRSQDGGRFSS